ncbi:hypothetical protein Tco_0466114, partial [Tanacetum coccineum]
KEDQRIARRTKDQRRIMHLDEMLAKRITEAEELIEEQKARKRQVQQAALHYTPED